MASRRTPPSKRRQGRPAPRKGKGADRRSSAIAIGALLGFAGLVLVLALFGGGDGTAPESRVAEVPATRTVTTAEEGGQARPQAIPARPAPVAPPPQPRSAAPKTGTPAQNAAKPTAPAADGTVQAAKPVPAAPPAAPAPQQVAAVRPLPPAWKRDRVEAPGAEGRPRIVIVIDDMGLDRRRSDRITALPGPLTLAWLPYARDLPAQTKAARAAGHELMVHVPMQPHGTNDPGPEALLTGLPEAEIRRRLDISLSAFDGYVGINNHMGSRFTADAAGMSVVLSELAARGLLFLDSKTTAVSAAGPLAEKLRLPIAVRDVFLDHEQTPDFLAGALAKVEATARENGLAIAIGHPHDVTAAALAAWLPTLPAKGFQLVPVSAAVRVQRPES